MKDRLISVLWIGITLVIFYFGFKGELFSSFFFVCLWICIAEIVAVATGPSAVNDYACKPHGAWELEILVLFFAVYNCMALSRDELLFVVLMCHASDVGAYLVGKTLGKHKAKLTESISPNKTVEGYIGGVISSALVVPLCLLFKMDFTPGLIAFLIVGGLGAEAGDLLGSAAKRQLGIKDSNFGLRNMPVIRFIEYPLNGMGGYLDRLDSISFNIVLFSILVPR